MKFLKAFYNFYYQMSIQELKLMKHKDLFKGCSYNSLLYMDVIAKNENCTVSMLAEILNITKSAVTIKVNELVQKGLVIKTQNPKDKRVFHLTLSPYMQSVYSHYDLLPIYLEKKMQEKYKPEEIELFCDMLQTMSELDWEENENE